MLATVTPAQYLSPPPMGGDEHQDPTTLALTTLTDWPSGCFTPTSDDFSTFQYDSAAAGDVPVTGLGVNTAPSVRYFVHGVQAPNGGMHYGQYFYPHLFHPQQALDNVVQRPLLPYPPHPQCLQQQSHFPLLSLFTHHDSGYPSLSGRSRSSIPLQKRCRQQHTLAPPPVHRCDGGLSLTSRVGGRRLRFYTTLDAPTAMIQGVDEAPVTYLNKGRMYTISIRDASASPRPSPPRIRYRTYVRVGFENEQHRAEPGAYWRLWREGRGSREAHQRDGRLLAVEYIDLNHSGVDGLCESQIKLERTLFDGFVVAWLPQTATHESVECSLPVRFHFLSTDFNRSRGVKGIPMRLRVKTEILDDVSRSNIEEAEACFAKIRLFR